MAAITLPIALQNLINFGVGMMDTLMVGKIGEVQLSAASMANQMTFMFMILSFGIANGCNVLSAQYWGRGDRAQVRRVVSFMYRVVMVLAVCFTLVAVLAPEWVLRLFIPDPRVIAEGVVYLRVVGWGFLFSGVTNSTIGMLRSIGTVRISVIIYSASLVVNTVLNYVLIFGKLGFPAMGIAGAAVATLISRAVETSIALIFLFRFEHELRFRPADLLHAGSEVRRAATRYSLPVLLNEILWSSGSMVVAAVLGHMGREVVAANSICMVLFQFAQSAIFGVSTSAATIIGNTIGEGNYELARRRARAYVGLAVLCGCVASLLMQMARFPLIGFYGDSISDLARANAYGMSAVASMLAIPQTVSMVLMMGVLRGGADTRFVMVADVAFMWLIAIPLGALAGLQWGLAVPLVYLFLKCEDLFKMVVAAWRVLSGRWIRDTTR